MPLLTPNHALVAAAAALGLTLYERGVFQGVWNALRGPAIPLDLGSAPAGAPGAAGGGAPPGSGALPPSTVTVPGGIDFTAAGNQVIAEGPPGGGSDWINWCLNWVNRTRQKLGNWVPALGAPTADAACNQLSLKAGPAPKGAIVCFRGNHIGLSNGNNTYTSAGITHGGLTIADYLSNPAYEGWTP